jgi:hypothetical protein
MEYDNPAWPKMAHKLSQGGGWVRHELENVPPYDRVKGLFKLHVRRIAPPTE